MYVTIVSNASEPRGFSGFGQEELDYKYKDVIE